MEFLTDNSEPDSLTLLLRRSQVLQCIEQLKTANTRAALIEKLESLRHLAEQPLNEIENIENGEGVENNHDWIEINQANFLAELNQIVRAQSLDRAFYYLERLERGLREIKTSSVNDINLNRWKEYDDVYTDSLWIIEKRDNSGVHSAGYWGNFVPQIPNQMLKRYTRRGDWIIDAFLGSGTTLIESQRLGRNAIGIELQPTVAERTRQLISAEPNRYNVVSEVVTADSATVDYKAILQKYNQQSAQLIILHPPYHDIIKFSTDPQDLSNAASVEAFLAGLGQVAANATEVLERGRYLVLVIGDKYSKGEWIPLGFHAMNQIQNLGFTLKSVVVKNFEDTTGKRQQKELWKYRSLVGGFYIFKHEYIFILKKK